MQATTAAKSEMKTHCEPSPASTTETRPFHGGGLGATGGLPLFLHPTIAVSLSADPDKQEADPLADQVLRMPAQTLQRTVAANSVCSPNVHNAPADPLATLRRVDALAQDMALGASHVLFLEAYTFRDPTFGRSYVFDAYRDWFGLPTQTASGAWRSRFRTATFATEDEAVQHELATLSERFQRIHDWLAGDIRYRCPGTGSYTIPGCDPGPCGSAAAQTCPTGSRTIGICPNFWVEPAPQDRAQAADLIHEAIHPLFHYRAHGMTTVAQRGRNPGCYQGFLHALFDTGLIPGDCTVAP